MSKKQSFSHIMRSLHRDLGYFVIGLTLIYTITGIVLSGRALGWLEQTYVRHTKTIYRVEFQAYKYQISLVYLRMKNGGTFFNERTVVSHLYFPLHFHILLSFIFSCIDNELRRCYYGEVSFFTK